MVVPKFHFMAWCTMSTLCNVKCVCYGNVMYHIVTNNELFQLPTRSNGLAWVNHFASIFPNPPKDIFSRSWKEKALRKQEGCITMPLPLCKLEYTYKYHTVLHHQLHPNDFTPCNPSPFPTMNIGRESRTSKPFSEHHQETPKQLGSGRHVLTWSPPYLWGPAGGRRNNER